MQILRIALADGKFILSDMSDTHNPKKDWKRMLPHLTKMCNCFGLKQKDVVFMEYAAWNFKEDEHPHYKALSLEMENSFRLALGGEPRLNPYYLFKYNNETGYTLLREPLK